MQICARAHPNIALIKYWGKSDLSTNLPSAGSLSVTLDGFTTDTTVAKAASDELLLNGEPGGAQADRVFRWLDACLTHRPPLHIDTRNNFPTAAGLASSASGFAALALAVDALLELGMSKAELSVLARRGSGSAARSIFGGFVQLKLGQDSDSTTAAPLLDAARWPLEVVIAVTQAGPKETSSGEGMERSRLTSPLYQAWTECVPGDLEKARDAIERRDFGALAEVSEASFLAMHAVMISSRPGLLYMKPASLRCVERVRELRREGLAAFCTMDAGPQVKIICLPEAADDVEAALRETPGVVELHRVGLGPGAHLVTA
ncbi:MAG: diphosphomevalonate decarboxylase [Pseudomonadota bacterium]